MKNRKIDIIWFLFFAVAVICVVPKNLEGFLIGAATLAVYLLIDVGSSALERSADKKAVISKGQQDEKHEKYLSSYGSIDSDDIHGGSMRSDLMYRFRSPLSLITAVLFAAFIVVCVFFTNMDIPMKIICILVFGGIAAVCLLIFFRMPVRIFYRRLSEYRYFVENSYINGKMFAFNKFGLRNGMNIGGKFVVLYTNYSVYAIPNDNIISFNRIEHREKYYSSGVYTGERMVYKIEIIASSSEINSKTSYSTELDELQAEKASEMLNSIITLNKIHNK